MSLPTAPKDVSAHPIKGSVVDPVVKADKEADVDRKIRLYGVIEAFRQGRMPSNAQIDETLQYVTANSPVDENALSAEGRKLIQDARDIVETARVMVQEKNADELFQNFVWHTRDVDVDAAKKDPSQVLPVDKEKAKDDGQIAVQHLRTILSLILTNSEVRKLLSDFSLIGRDLLARGASKAADGLRPDQEALAHVNDSAPNDQFVTKGGRTAGPNETPVLEARVPGTDHTVSQHPKDALGTGATVKTSEGETLSGQEAYERGQNKAGELQAQGQGLAQDAQGQAQDHIDDVQNSSDPEVASEEKKRGLFDKVRGLRDNLSSKVPQEHKDRAAEHKDRAREFFTEEYFPEERRDQFIFRGKKVIIECQKHDDYQESIRWLLGYAEEYAAHGKTIAAHGKDSHGALTGQDGLQTATSELRTLLERFAGGQSMDVVFDAANALIEDAKADEGLREWFKSVDAYLRKVLLDAGYVLEPDCNSRGTAIRDSGRQFYDGKYKTHFDNLFSSVGTFFKAMGNDPLNVRFGEDWARLTRDLLFDSEGGLKFKPELWGDIRKVILPTLVDKVGYIPIPRIEYTDDALDLVVENLTLSGRNLFPNVVSLEAHNFVKFSPYATIPDEGHHEFTFTFAQMQADMRDVAFYFRKKTGIPKLSDSGLADVVLGGEGLTATVHLVASTKDKSSVFKVKNVVVKVDTLKFSIRDSKHDFLYKTLKPLATGLVKKQIQKAIKDAITTGMEYVDGQLVGVRDRYDAAKATEGASRAQVLHDTFAQKKEEASATASTASAKNSHFKVVHNKRNSILSDSGHPAGWVNRTTEREESAVKGADWRSEAFSIVNPTSPSSPTSPTAGASPSHVGAGAA
ncbi:hypothetical protein FIBSPDRAFT_912787 [Athelia psychrophila]|uniref:Uncharacterized protein n=1 Tax=Athelia psychrophila TaxID=1759441 RepID=A0A166D8Q1_9AGAM|nr:hypothetical protein FIBSPDRAFT_912787 [Fibularhizoctonia sp. CBS 109695]